MRPHQLPVLRPLEALWRVLYWLDRGLQWALTLLGMGYLYHDRPCWAACCFLGVLLLEPVQNRRHWQLLELNLELARTAAALPSRRGRRR